MCTTCGGRGSRYRVTIDYDSDGHPVDRVHWESCYACGGQGTGLCWRCGGTSEIRSYDATGADAEPTEASASHLPRSPRDLQDEFDLTKRDILALLLECDLLGDFEMRRKIRDELRAVAIDTPDAYEKLTAFEEPLARHPACKGSEVFAIKWRIAHLGVLCSDFRTCVALRAKGDPQPATEETSSRVSRYSTNKAVADLQKRAEQGNAEAQFALAMRLLQGAGIPKDIDQGLRWIRSAEAQGYNDAKYELGRRVLQGRDIQRNVEEGKRLLNDAAEHGHSGAARALQGPRRPRR